MRPGDGARFFCVTVKALSFSFSFFRFSLPFHALRFLARKALQGVLVRFELHNLRFFLFLFLSPAPLSLQRSIPNYAFFLPI